MHFSVDTGDKVCYSYISKDLYEDDHGTISESEDFIRLRNSQRGEKNQYLFDPSRGLR